MSYFEAINAKKKVIAVVALVVFVLVLEERHVAGWFGFALC